MVGTSGTIDLDRFIAAESSLSPLPAEVIEIISGLAARVSAPEYVRTPQFSRRGRRARDSRATEWTGSASDPSFKATVLVKRKGMEGTIDQVRKHVNKMSESTYVRLRDKVFAEIDGQEGASTSTDVAEAVLGFACANAFYASLYARFYSETLARYVDFKEALLSRLAQGDTELASVEYADPITDYDGFCANNKTNAARRAAGVFYVHLAELGVIEKTRVIGLLGSLQGELASVDASDAGKARRDELAERIFAMLTAKASAALASEDGWASTIAAVRTYAALKPGSAPHVTSKSIFRHMDILDALAERSRPRLSRLRR